MASAIYEQLDLPLAPVPCPCCGSSQMRVVLSPHEIEGEREWLLSFHKTRQRSSRHMEDHAEFTQGEPTFIVACQECGTLRRNPQPGPEFLANKYRGDSYGTDTLHELLIGQRAFFRAKARELSRRLPAGCRVLEIGSFVGAFLLAAREMGWDATGVDIGEETCSFMRGLGLHVLEGAFEEQSMVDRFDAAFVWNTFDQLSKPSQLLSQLKACLKPDGLLVVRVPNARFESACLELRQNESLRERVLLAQAYNNFLTFPYLYGYTPESLGGLMRRHGFSAQGHGGDVLVPLATSDTLPWAVAEEAGIKRLILRLCRRSERAGSLVYPWMDIHAGVSA